jgi:hypothetical protein
MSRRRVVIEYNENADQYEWEIQEYVVIGADSMGWRDIPGDSFAGQNEFYNEAAEMAYESLNLPKGI